MLFVWTFIFLMVLAVSLWNMFTKAGRKGWEALIPIYNGYVLTEIAGKPGWLILLVYVPYIFLHMDVSSTLVTIATIVSAIVYMIISIDIAKVFGKSTFFGVVGIFFFSFFGFMILGWGDAKYQKPNHKEHKT